MDLKFVGAVRATGSTATIVWQTGFLATFARTSAGLYVATHGADYAVDGATQNAPTVSLYRAIVASGLTAFGYADTSDVAKSITCVTEAALGAASVAADADDLLYECWKRIP